MGDEEATPKKTVQMRVTVPINVHKYLGFLARTTNMGGTEGDVAVFLLQAVTEEMREKTRYKIDFPEA